MRFFLLCLTICASGQALADNISVRRACLDELKDTITIWYSYSFTAGVECNTATVALYGAKDGSGFNRIGVNATGLKKFSVGADNSKDWRFFVRLINTCDDDSVTSTDTLVADLTGPTGANIDSVSVREDGVIIGWTASGSKDLRNYAVYYDDEESGLSTTLDTVSRNDSSYVEVVDSVNTDEKSITYTIAAFDSCDLSTGQLERHSTVHLELSAVDYCKRDVVLERTEYGGWGNSVVYQLLYKVEGTQLWRPWIDYTNGRGLELNFDDLKVRFELKVQARDLATDYTSSSNAILLDFREERTLDTFYVYSVNNYGSQIEMKWWCSTPDLVQKVNLLSVRDGVISDIRTITTNIKRNNSTKLGNVVPGTAYYFEAFSKCNERLGTTNRGVVVGLEITNGVDMVHKGFNTERDMQRVLVWNEYGAWTNGTDNYVLERKLNNDWEELSVLSDFNYTDGEQIEELLDSGMCYRVKAVEREGVLGFNGESVSNEMCFTFDFHKCLPNAFIAVKSGESYFKVNTEGLDTSGSFMQIFNRWGQMVYSEGVEWNGGINNDVTRPCATGIYYYVLKTQLKNRKFYYSTGQIHLIR